MASKMNVGVRVEGRMVPFPKSISPEALASLQRMVDADGVPIGVARVSPAPDDFDGWMAFKAVGDEGLMQMLGAAASAARSSVETIELGGATVHVATPAGAFVERHAYLEVHGGGLLIGGGEPTRIFARLQADLHNVRCYGVDYRMPPEHPYPAALNDCVAVYRALLEQYDAANIVIGGGSAGGNLAASTVLRARDEGLPLPAALVLMTPEVDLTESGDTFETNQLFDVMLVRPLMAWNLLYAAGHDLAHPYLSPLFGDFTKGFPPTLLSSGTRDLFLSNTVRMHRALRRAGVPVDLHVIEGMPHGGFNGAPEDRELSQDIAEFVNAHWKDA